MAQQYNRIQKCLGNLYCSIKAKEEIGKPVNKEKVLMKKLWLCLEISPYIGFSCPIDCFLDANCLC